jgi:hypothetical protein
LNLGGTMIWSLDQDDYTGLFCEQGQFPFTRRVHDIIFSSNDSEEQDFSNPTKATKLRTKQKISFVPIQRLTTSKHQKLTSTESSSKAINGTVKNSSTLYLLVIILLFNITR